MAHVVPLLARPRSRRKTLRQCRRDPSRPSGGAGEPRRSRRRGSWRGLADGRVRAARRRGPERYARSLLPSVTAVWPEQARALIGLRVRLWWRRIVHGRQWARLLIGALAAIMGGSFSASLCLFALQTGEEMRRRPEWLAVREIGRAHV